MREMPKLKKSNPKGKKYHYKLSDRFKERKLAIDEGISKGAVKYGGIKKAANKKKARLNVLRIYRRYSNPGDCRKITRDMRYIDEKYLKEGKTKNICGVKNDKKRKDI